MAPRYGATQQTTGSLLFWLCFAILGFSAVTLSLARKKAFAGDVWRVQGGCPLIEMVQAGSANGLRQVVRLATGAVRMGKEMDVQILKWSDAGRVVREGTTGKQVAVVESGTGGRMNVKGAVVAGPSAGLRLVPRIWAVADASSPAADAAAGSADVPVAQPKAGKLLKPDVAFYRKYTEGLLRRYLRMSTEAGRVPSFLGRELFRGNVTSYKVRSFEDVVIFCYDVEKCLKTLDKEDLELIKRVAFQSYTKAEAACMLGMSLRWCGMRYAQAIDKLTHELIRLELMNPQEAVKR